MRWIRNCSVRCVSRTRRGRQSLPHLPIVARLAREPLGRIGVTARRTGVDGAYCVTQLVDLHSPNAEKIVRVLDELNAHTPTSRYEAFPPAEAKRIADRLESYHTPKHGRWRNLPKRHPQRSSSASWCDSAWDSASRMPSDCETATCLRR